MAEGVELFHASDAEPYASIRDATHIETWGLKDTALRCWLARQYFQKYGKAPSSQSLRDTLAVLEGRALFDGPEQQVFTRLADTAVPSTPT